MLAINGITQRYRRHVATCSSDSDNASIEAFISLCFHPNFDTTLAYFWAWQNLKLTASQLALDIHRRISTGARDNNGVSTILCKNFLVDKVIHQAKRFRKGRSDKK